MATVKLADGVRGKVSGRKGISAWWVLFSWGVLLGLLVAWYLERLYLPPFFTVDVEFVS